MQGVLDPALAVYDHTAYLYVRLPQRQLRDIKAFKTAPMLTPISTPILTPTVNPAVALPIDPPHT